VSEHQRGAHPGRDRFGRPILYQTVAELRRLEALKEKYRAQVDRYFGRGPVEPREGRAG
jgi:hypothetical protein